MHYVANGTKTTFIPTHMSYYLSQYCRISKIWTINLLTQVCYCLTLIHYLRNRIPCFFIACFLLRIRFFSLQSTFCHISFNTCWHLLVFMHYDDSLLPTFRLSVQHPSSSARLSADPSSFRNNWWPGCLWHRPLPG